MHASHDRPSKRHARLRYQPQAAVLWVGSEDDWALARREPRPPLVCPQPGCDTELITYENLHNRYNPRIFKLKSGSQSCGHWDWASRGPGGPESDQHQWMKQEVQNIARRLGYTATAEHFPTRADVFVHESRFCLEVQLVGTDFHGRTEARRARDVKVCWLIRDGLDTPQAVRALFHEPAVRFRIIDPRRRPLAPWEHRGDPELSRRARLEVFGTVAYPPRAGTRADPAPSASDWFRTKTMDGELFLRQILSGRRRWYPPNELGHSKGLWVLDTDVAAYRAFCRRPAKTAACQPGAGAEPGSELAQPSAVPLLPEAKAVEPPVTPLQRSPGHQPPVVAARPPGPQPPAQATNSPRRPERWWRRFLRQ